MSDNDLIRWLRRRSESATPDDELHIGWAADRIENLLRRITKLQDERSIIYRTLDKLEAREGKTHE